MGARNLGRVQGQKGPPRTRARWTAAAQPPADEESPTPPGRQAHDPHLIVRIIGAILDGLDDLDVPRNTMGIPMRIAFDEITLWSHLPCEASAQTMRNSTVTDQA